MTQHSALTGASLHEPKGVAAASANTVYVANGAGSGTWTSLTLPKMYLIKTTTASSSAQVEFINGTDGVVLDNTYDYYKILFANVAPATDNVDFQLRVGTGAGPTWQTGASAYKTACHVILTGVGNTSAIGTATDKILLTYNGGGNYAVGNGSGECISGEINFTNPEVTTNYPMFRFHTGWFGANNELGHSNGMGFYLTQTAFTGVRLFFSSGNISSGSFSLYGIKTS